MMLILQLSGAVILFIYGLKNSPYSVELQLSVLLSYCALVLLPHLFTRRIFFLAGSLLSLFLIILILPMAPLSGLLIPFSLILLLHRTGYIQPWLPLLSIASIPLIPEEIRLLYLGINLAALFLYFRDNRLLQRQQKAKSQLEMLQKQLEEKEALLRQKQEEAQNQEILSALEERSRISRDLHDHLGHVISGSVMQIQAAEILLEKDPAGCRASLEKTETTLKEGMEKIRRILHSQNPMDDELGLPRIRKLLLDFTGQSRVECSLETEGPMEALSSLQWNTIQSSLKEALTNVHKYSSADHFLCRIEVLNRLIRVEFRDNGNPPPHIHFGMGLKNMEERARNLGGKLLCHSRNGLSITLLLPKGETT